jgi:hypothetical protein
VQLLYSSVNLQGTGIYSQTLYNIARSLADPYPGMGDDNYVNFKAIGNLHFGDDEGPVVAGIHPFERLSLGAVYNYNSGLPYTETWPYEEVGFRNTYPIPAGDELAVRMPSYSAFDLKLERPISAGGVDITPFLWITNLFNRENVVDVYSGSGEPDETGFLNTELGQTWIEEGANPDAIDGSGMTFEEKYHLAERDPLNYGAPRQVMLGLQVRF